jgi:formylglycine-generating enzyme required for sulfatase activity/cytochrome c553
MKSPFVVMAIVGTATTLGFTAAPSATPLPKDSSAGMVFSFRPEPLRAAIQDLNKAYGAKYPHGMEYLEQLGALEKARDAALASWRSGASDSDIALEKLGCDLRALERDALLANPLLDFDNLLLVKRAYQVPANRVVNRGKGKKAAAAQQTEGSRSPQANPWSYNENLEGDALGLPVNHNSIFSIRRTGYDNEICVLSPVRPEGELRTLFKPQDGLYVGEVELDFDGKKMLVTMPENDRWQVFELGADGKGLNRITPNEESDVDSYDACYVPDGRIIFCSTAAYQAIPCWQGLHNTASLYLLDRANGRIRQLTFDQDDDNYPSVLNDGRILFTRWEYANIPHFFGRLLFSMNPDGTDQREFYGSNSYWPNAIYFARAVPGHPSMVAGIVSGHHGDFRMGNLALFDPERGRQRTQGLVFRAPNAWHHNLDKLNRAPDPAVQLADPGQQGEPIVRDRLTSHDWPKFLHPFPLSENYLLVSAKLSPQSNWGIYLADTFGNLTLIRECEGQALLEPIPLRPTPRPPVNKDRVDLAQKEGTVYLLNAQTGPGLTGVPTGQVKKLRVFAYDFGYRGLSGFDKISIDGCWDVMRILGTVPVEADGSAAFRVPANTPIAVQPLDEKNRALQLMRSWFTVMPGEVKSCVGCHEPQNSGPPSKPALATLREPSKVTPWYGPPRGFSFEREVQPVLNKYCVACHDGKETVVNARSKPDLRALALRPDYKGILANAPQWYDASKMVDTYNAELQRIGQRKHVPIKFTPAYETLIKYVRRTGPEGDYHLLNPGEYYADTSALVQLLEQGHHGVELNAEAWDRLITWIDLNVPCHGNWSEALPIPFNGAKRKHELSLKYGGPDYDPEAIPVGPANLGEPVTTKKKTAVAGDSTALGWPFDRFEAARRQQAAGPRMEKTVALGNGRTLKLVLIPAGEFIMGNAVEGSRAEWPQSRVRVDRAFWMGACEVSNDQFAQFDPAHDSRYERGQKMNVHDRGYPMNEPRQPVVRVSWQEAMKFCAWLSARTGLTFTLPTEAQWEYACRAGSAQPMWWGDRVGDFSELANLADRTILGFTKWNINALNQIYNGWMPYVPYVDDGAMASTTIGKYVANAWGLFDMHGNVAEWTLSLYHPYPYVASDGRENPQGEGLRVVRGGAWCDLPQMATASWRYGAPAWRKLPNTGFRVVCPADSMPASVSAK